MAELCQRAKMIAGSDMPVLICGETGTGKELLADMIHAHSPRAHRVMLKINCAAFTESLLDNELFGHEKGSFTGATGSFKGIFEKADKGSIVLDELSTMSLPTQAKILRTIQNQEIRRIGGSETISIDVRFIAATNENLDDLMQKNLFRKDLYYRLNSAVLRIPPLRERPDDIPALVDSFLDSLSDGSSRRQYVSSRVLEMFYAHDWPGNVRELRSVIQYADAVSTDGCIDVEDLPPTFNGVLRTGTDVNIRSASERNLILKVLRETGNNKSRTAAILSMSRATLYSKMAKLGIDKAIGQNER
jgi:transcriptional regulator with PAS, ATPase and Fis domain